jgi:GNAT superfamily N-acetyltransferase
MVERQGVVPVERDRVRAVAAAVARGFHDNEIWVWLQANEHWRRRLMERTYRTLMRRVYLRRGAAWTTPDPVGAALWIAPGEPKRVRGDQFGEAIAAVPWIGRGLGRASRFDAMANEHHPHEPHWYLEVLSVEPKRQRQGYGSALLEPGLERCDAEGMPAYLETQREANIAFYRRFGFEVVEKLKLPDSPPLWTMWRESR